MSETEIHLAVSENPDSWTNSSDDVASGWVARAIEQYESRLVAAVCAAQPNATITVRRVPETLSFGNRHKVYVTGQLPLSPEDLASVDDEDRILADIMDIESQIEIADVD